MVAKKKRMWFTVVGMCIVCITVMCVEVCIGSHNICRMCYMCCYITRWFLFLTCTIIQCNMHLEYYNTCYVNDIYMRYELYIDENSGNGGRGKCLT